MKNLTLALLFFACTLNAKLEDHFQKITDKTGDHSIENVDFIYMINLDVRPEKYERAVRQLHLYGIDPYRFSAVNGWELSLSTINDVGVVFEPWMSRAKWGTYYPGDKDFESFHEQVQCIGRNYFCHCMSRGAIGIALSQLSILQDAYDSGYETIWVMEDDVDILRNPHLVSELIEKLDALVGKDGWDIFFTDQDTKNTRGEYVPCTGFAWRPNFAPPNPDRFAKREVLSPDFKKVGARFGAYSMIVRRSGMKKILDFLKNYQLFLPFDMEYTYPTGIQLISMNYDIVSTYSGAHSDNGAPNYLKKGE